MLADEANEFEVLENYALDGEPFWGIDLDALSSRTWSDTIAVHDIVQGSRGPLVSKNVRHVTDVCKGFSGPPYERIVIKDWTWTFDAIVRTKNGRKLPTCALCR